MKTKIRNVAVLDMTTATPESISQIESIANAAVVIVTPQTRNLVSQLSIQNLANIVEIKDAAMADMSVQVHNGNTTMAAQMFETPGVMLLNGNVIIPGDIQVSDVKAMLLVNGTLYAPTNLQAEIMGHIQHNGNLITYPQDYELMLGDLDLDACTVAPGSKFHVVGKLIAVKGDAQTLREKNIRVHCGNAYVTQGLESAFAELDAKQVIPVPAGYAFLGSDIRVDDMTAVLHGARLFILGNIDVRSLEGIESLRVTGRAYVPEKLARDFMRLCPGFPPAQLVVYGERMVRLSDCKLEPEMLEGGKKTYVMDNVEIDEAVTRQMLEDGVESFYLFGDIACASGVLSTVQELCKLQHGDILNARSDIWRMMQEGKAWGQLDPESLEADGYRIIRNAVTYKL